jgi:hypothetical protein
MSLLLIVETIVPMLLMSLFIVLIAVRFLPVESQNVEEN